MKNNNVKILFLACITTATMISCTESPKKEAEKVENAKEAVVDAKIDLAKARQDSADEYTQYKMASETRIRENDSLIADLKTRIKEEKKEARSAYEKQVKILDEKNEKLKATIHEYKENDKNKWQSFKLKFNQDMDELGKSISALAHRNMDKK